MRSIGDRQDFSRLRPHQNNRGLLRRILLHRGVDFVLDDVLQTKVDGQVDLIAVAWSPLLSAIRYDLLASPVVFDETIAVLAVKIFLHRGFNALDTVMIKIGKPNNVTEHGAIWVNSRGIMLEINSAQIGGAKFFTQRVCCVLGYFALDHDVTAIAV